MVAEYHDGGGEVVGLEVVDEVCEPVTVIRACRDPRDDTLPELAVAGGADVIVTGDSDLLALGPFESIAITTPARFLTARPE